MTGMAVDGEARKKRILWRASHRGIKEMDLILGGFAAAHVAVMADDDLSRFEQLLEVPDQQFLAWMTGTEAVPEAMRSPMLDSILQYRP